ncbi:MAG: PAS domain-containing sensor histidine kinase [Anaerolineae bacterium]
MSSSPASEWQTQRFRAIVEQQTELVCCYLPDGTLTFVNDAYCRFFGLSREELIGRRFADVITIKDIPDITEHIRWQVTHCEPRFVVQRGWRADGTACHVEWTDQCLFNEQGEIVEILAVGRDATDRLAAQQEHTQLAEMRAELENEREMSDWRSRILRVMTHEMRTPLAMIQLSTDLLVRYRDRLPQEEYERRLIAVQSQIRDMDGMLDDFSFSLRAQMKKLVLNLSQVNVQEMTEQLVREMELTIGRDHPFNVETEPGSTLVAEADAGLLHRVLSNLLTNAIKYSPPGMPIEIRLRLRTNDLQIDVRDHGIGIDETEQAHIFEPFYRGQNVGSVQGSGIGLSLVRDCITAHSGSIRVKSQVGIGSNFTIHIPQPVPRPASNL